MEKKTILVIDDDELNIKLIKAILQLGEYAVLEAPDAETGLNLAQTHRPDLILIDIQLPDMDGLEATRIIKANRLIKDIPVIGLSGMATQEMGEKAIDAGCLGYITKPVEVRGFLKKISQYMEESE